MYRNLNTANLGVSAHQSEIIELAMTNSFQGIDLDVSEFATRAKLRGVAYARRLLDSSKLKLGSFVLPIEFDAEDAAYTKRLQRLPEYVQAAADAGCERAMVTVAPSSNRLPYHENFELHRKRLADVCGVLRASNITLGVGFQAPEYLRKDVPFQFIHDFDALALLVNMVAAPNLGLVVDLYDVFVGGGSIETLRKLKANQVVAVEVANYAADAPVAELTEQSRLLPGVEGGAIDVAAALLALSDIGYKGPVTAKPSRGQFRGLRRDAIVKEAGDSLLKVWKNAGFSIPQRPMAVVR